MDYEIKDLDEQNIIDAYGRRIEKLRIILTNKNISKEQSPSNPENKPPENEKELLRFDEISEVVKIAASLGIHQIKLVETGPRGLPNIEDLIEALAGIERIDDISFVTYGLQLEGKIPLLKEKGLHRITFAIDTLAPKRYSEITGGGKLNTVLQNLRQVLSAGFKNTKVNVLVMKSINDDEYADFVHLAISYDIEVRFVEYVPVGVSRRYAQELFLPLSGIFRKISGLVELERLSREPGATTQIFKIKNQPGRIGFIAPISELFCFECSRLNLSASGELVSCLIDGGKIDIKRFLRPEIDRGAIKRAFMEAADRKPLKHHLHRFLQELQSMDDNFD